MKTLAKRIDPAALNLKEQVVAINRVTKVVKGGKNLSFSALVVIGDPSAKVVGYGVGKAKEVPSAIRKGIEAAKKALRHVNVLEITIAHQVLGQFSSSQVLLKPAPAGTGRGGLEEHLRTRELAEHLVGDGDLQHVHVAQRLLGRFDALADGGGNFLGLPYPVSDHFGRRIADDDQRRKAEVLTALDHLGNAVDGHDLFFEVESRRIDAFR